MALSPTVDINTNPLAAATFATQYGPQTQQALRKSQYLADALRQLSTSGQDIKGGWGELGAKLLATAILQRSNNQGQDQLIKAMGADQQAETDKMLAGIAPSGAAPTGEVGPQAAPPAPINLAPATQPDAPPSPPAQPATQYSDRDRDALTRMLATEAIGEGDTGMAAAGHVALNRLASGYGGAKTLADVVYQPHQFTGMAKAAQVSPQDYARAGQVADGLLSGQVPDPTHGAQAFLNPELTQQLYGRIPKWAQGGDGVRIGRHVFFGGQSGAQPPGPQVAQTAAQPPPPPPPPDPNGPAVQDVPPYQIAANGQTPPPPQASAPNASPAAAGAAPAGVPPQAPPAGAPAGPKWPTWKPTQEDHDYVQSLLMDPKTHALGVQAALKMREKMAEPVEAQITMINGMPFYVPKDPDQAAPSIAIPVPKEAMSRVQTAEQLGVAAPRGTTFTTDPLGNSKPLVAPPNGQQVTSAPGQPYTEHYVLGGVNDPTRPQTPSAGYQYGPNGQAPIKGGPADPTAPMNVVAGTQKIQESLRPQIDAARENRQSYGTVGAGYKLQNGAGDVAMLKGLNQLVSRGAVRPDDMERLLKSDGIAGGIGELTQYINSNGVLTPEARNKVMLAAQSIFGAADHQYRAQVMSHKQTVDAVYGGGSFDKYVLPPEQADALGWIDRPAVAPQAPTPTPTLPAGTHAAAIAEARRRGLVH